MQTLVGAAGNLGKLAHGNYPAQNYILKVIHDGLPLTIDGALEIEARYFTKLLASKEAKNMIRTGFTELQKAKKGIARPKSVGSQEYNIFIGSPDEIYEHINYGIKHFSIAAIPRISATHTALNRYIMQFTLLENINISFFTAINSHPYAS